MNLRGKNFIGQIFDISVIKATIEGLIGGDVYYFYINVSGVSRVLYVKVEEFADGEKFELYIDNTKFIEDNTYQPIPVLKTDKLIKVIKSSSEPDTFPIEVCSYSSTPSKDMANYVLVYIDTLQTI